MGRQQGAYCTDALALPSTITLPWEMVSCAVNRSRLINKGSAFWPISESNLAKRRATMLATRLPKPMSTNNSSSDLLPVKRSNLSHKICVFASTAGMFSIPSARRACAKSFSPKSFDSVCAMVLRWWRILERARPVRTKPSHAGFGVASGEVTTSTTSPFDTSVRRGTEVPLIFAAVAWSPTSLWTA